LVSFLTILSSSILCMCQTIVVFVP
jgi:hypothetical protein